MNNKYIKFIISNNWFAFFYIVAFFFVGYMAIFKKAGDSWVLVGWSMLSILGIIITITAYTTLTQALESKSWPQSIAKITKATVTEGRTTDNGQVHTPEVEYEYSFEGKHYKGCQVDFSSMSSTEKWAQGVIDKITKNGINITVFVNPYDPSVSVIFPGARLVHLLRFIVGPAMIIVGILFGLKLIEL